MTSPYKDTVHKQQLPAELPVSVTASQPGTTQQQEDYEMRGYTTLKKDIEGQISTEQQLSPYDTTDRGNMRPTFDVKVSSSLKGSKKGKGPSITKKQ